MSEKGSIKKSTAQAICDAVKVKEGTTEGVPFKDVAERILALPTASGEDNLAKLAKGTLTELTAEDLEGVTSIPAYFMYEAPDSLKKLTLPDGLEEVGSYSFRNLTLDNLSIPYSLVDVGTAYAGITGSTENLYYRGDIDAYLGVMLQSITRKNLYINNELIEQHLVLDKHSNKRNARGSGICQGYRIGGFAFYGCENLLSFTSCACRTQFGRYALANCPNLKTVTFRTKEVEKGSSSGSNPDYALESTLFYNCPSLTDIYVPWSEGEISNAPWGANSNVTIHYNSPIPFTIDGVEYQYVLNQGWGEWLNSEYNTGGFYLDGSDIRTQEGKYLYYLDEYNSPTKLKTNDGRVKMFVNGTVYFSQED